MIKKIINNNLLELWITKFALMSVIVYLYVEGDLPKEVVAVVLGLSLLRAALELLNYILKERIKGDK